MTQRAIHAPRGAQLNCKGWQQEAALRCLMNNLDPAVAEKPDELIVYGGAGKAARNSRACAAVINSIAVDSSARSTIARNFAAAVIPIET